MMRLLDTLLAGKTGIRRYIGPKRLLGLGLISILVIGTWHLRQNGLLSPEIATSAIDSHPLTSIAVFLAIYAVALLLAVPTLPFNLAAGVFWGAAIGGGLTAIATTAGAILAFLAARFLFGQPLAHRFDNRRLEWLQNAYDKHGWHVVAFTRLNPVFPTGALNYLFGLTSIGLWTYTWATIVFILPPSIAVAWIGSAMGTMVLDGSSATLWQAIIAVSAAVTILVAARLVAKLFSIPTDSDSL